MSEAWHDSLKNSARNVAYNGWGALKAAAAAERSADESLGIFRHTNTTNPGPVTSPSFSSRAYGPQSNPSATSISPEALQLQSPTRASAQMSDTRTFHQPQQSQNPAQPFPYQYQQPIASTSSQGIGTANSNQLLNSNTYAAPSNQPFSAHNNMLQYGNQQPIHAQDGIHDMSHAFINPDMPPIFPLTNEGVPYDAFEDDLVAFFRGDVPSYLDSFNFSGNSGSTSY